MKRLFALLLFVFPLAAQQQYLVTNTNDSGAGSLRAAIEEANATCDAGPGELCTIAFRIPVSAAAQWATIRPATPLPAITKPRVMIDGGTQTRFADTNPQGPEIEIDGGLLQLVGNGITLAACNAAVHDLTINGFPDNGVFIVGPDCTGQPAGQRFVVGNYIGTDPTGTQARPNLRGVFIARDGGHFSRDWIAQNVISGNRFSGVWVGIGRAAILLNKIGLNAKVTAGLGNGSSGIFVGAGGGAEIGDNYIGFNGHYGISAAHGAKALAFRNSIQANGNLGIDHGLDGPSASVPVITIARYDAVTDTTIIEGSVDVAGGNGRRTYTVTLYANDAPDASGYGEGQYFLGHADVDAEGRFTFTYRGRTPGRWIAAAVTSDELIGELEGFDVTTSEFSRTVEVSQ